MDYLYKTEPLAHQKEAFELSKDMEAFALLMEQGTGKTKIGIDTAAYNFSLGRIDALLVIAPSGVHRNWVKDEIPKHMPEYINYKAAYWDSSKAATKKHAAKISEVISHDGLAILAINIDAITTNAGNAACIKMLYRKCALFADETTNIKTPGAKRTRRAIAYSRRAVMKRIFNGTPITQGPLDLYSQFYFLDPYILGFQTFLGFKNHFAIWEERSTRENQNYKVIVEYQNLDELKQKIAPYSYRKTKAECLDLPPVVLQPVYFDMGKEQKRHYKALRDQYLTELDSGEEVYANFALTRLLRLQQITCGYLPLDSGGMQPIGDGVRLAKAMELIEQAPADSKFIIWARFIEDINQIVFALRERGFTYARYDGQVSDDEKEAGKRAFNEDPNCRFFVANPQAAGVGLTLNAASHVIRYSNDFSLYHFEQAKDRCHRIGQTKTVIYYDLIANDTVDEKILAALKSKKDIANEINGDEIADMIAGDE